MPHSNKGFRKVVNASVVEWEIEGQYLIDCYYPSTNYYVLVEDDQGEVWVHEHVFNDSAELVEDGQGDCFVARSWGEGLKEANRLADRVNSWGIINLDHWGYHDFFSLSLEERLHEEWIHENMHRKGHGDLSKGVFSGGHE